MAATWGDSDDLEDNENSSDDEYNVANFIAFATSHINDEGEENNALNFDLEEEVIVVKSEVISVKVMKRESTQIDEESEVILDF